MIKIPGVMGRAVGCGFGRAHQPPLRCIGATHADKTGLAKLHRQIGVLLGGEVQPFQELHAIMQRLSGRPAEQVFHHKRHASKGAVRQVGGLGLGTRLVKQGVNHRVELGVELFDPGNRGIDQLQGRSLSVFDEFGLGGRIQIRKLVWHDGTPLIQAIDKERGYHSAKDDGLSLK